MRRGRQLIRLLLGALLYYSGIFTWLLRRKARRGAVCVLGLHRILSEARRSRCHSQAAIVLNDSVFEELLAFLVRHFELVSLGCLTTKDWDTGNPRPKCAITFDDGWEDNYTTAYPLLLRKRVPASIFLATGMIGGQKTFWVERVFAVSTDPKRWAALCDNIRPALGKNTRHVNMDDAIEYLKHMSSDTRQALIDRYVPETAIPYNGDQMLTWEQVREMGRDNIEFGSHTETHPLLIYEEPDTIERELRSSRYKIQTALERDVPAFAYPNGDWNEQVRDLVREAGYRYAFTTWPGWYHPEEDPYTVPRILLHDGNVTGPDGRFSPAVFSLTVMGWR